MAKKILRWLLSNLLLILVIVSVIYGYIYWGNLTGGSTPAGKAVGFLSQKFDGVGEFVEGVKNKQARLAGTQTDQQSDKQFGKSTSQQVAVGSNKLETEVPANTQKSIRQDVATGHVTKGVTKGVTKSATEKMAAEKQNTATSQFDSMLTNKVDSAAVTAFNHEQINSEQTKEQAVAEEKDSRRVVAEQTATNTATSPAGANFSQLESEQQPASISYSHNNTRVKQNSDGETESLPQPQSLTAETENSLVPEAAIEVGSKPDVKSDKHVTKDGFISAEVAEQVESVNEDSGLEGNALRENASVESTSSTAQSLVPQATAAQSSTMKTKMSIQDTWLLARKSFYQKEYDLSVQSYQSVIAATKDNFDAYGELGNVYFSQGGKSQAADAYLRAATILLTKGQGQRAQSLLRVLQQLDMSKANQLQHLMDMPSL